MTGLELQHASERQIANPIVFLGGSSDVPMAVVAMKNGAADFIEILLVSQFLVDGVRATDRRHRRHRRHGQPAASAGPRRGASAGGAWRRCRPDPAAM
jgi:FixJ family two-component response regulator